MSRICMNFLYIFMVTMGILIFMAWLLGILDNYSSLSPAILKAKNNFIFTIDYQQDPDNLVDVSEIEEPIKQQIPIIFGWNSFWDKPIYEFRYLKWGQPNCPFECQFTENKSLEQSATVLMFHGANGLGKLPQNRRPNQLYTFMSHESPPLTSPKLFELPNSFFNLTITYRKDSSIYIPYEEFQEIGPDTPANETWSQKEILDRISRKKRLALQMVSNCNSASSGRGLLTDQLKELIELDVFGKCNGQSCDDRCYEEQMDSHFFYMAFENSVCPEYMTEKFWKALRRLVVPVVLKRSVPKQLGVPDDAYIAVDDFDSIQAFADHLKALQRDPARYASYFNWTKKYTKTWDHDIGHPSALCRLCEMAHHQLRDGRERHPGVDMSKFWSEQQCQNDFVQKELFKRKS